MKIHEYGTKKRGSTGRYVLCYEKTTSRAKKEAPEESDHHILYRVTPDFRGKDLLAHDALIEAYSLEDQGEGIQFCVYCYNVQPGVLIDYSTGEAG